MTQPAWIREACWPASLCVPKLPNMALHQEERCRLQNNCPTTNPRHSDYTKTQEAYSVDTIKRDDSGGLGAQTREERRPWEESGGLGAIWGMMSNRRRETPPLPGRPMGALGPPWAPLGPLGPPLGPVRVQRQPREMPG